MSTMHQHAKADRPVDELFAALANPTRRELLRLLLRGGELPVREMAARFDMARPSVSEHLAVRRKAGGRKWIAFT
jgi:DNA-binding transcriptional ArsR family regulator